MNGRAPAASTGDHPRTMRADLSTTMRSNVVGILGGVVVTFVAPRLLDQDQYGMFGWAMSASYILASVAALGLPLRMIADVPQLDRDQQTSIIAMSLHLTVAAAGLVGLLLALLGTFAPQVIGRTIAPIAIYTGALVMPVAVLAVASAAFRARGLFRASVLTSEQMTRLAWIVGLAAAAVTISTARVVVAIAIGVLTTAASLAYLLLGASPVQTPHEPIPRFMRRTLPFIAGSLGTALLPQAGALTLGARSGSDDVAEFTGALRLVMVCSIVAAASTRVIGPRISAHRGTNAELTRLVRPIATLIFWSTLAAAAPVILGGPPLMRVLLGPSFGSSWAPASLMLAGLLVNAFTGPAGQILYNRGHQRVIGSTTLAAGLLYLPVSLGAAHVAGTTGVAAASSAIIAVLAIGQSAWVLHKTGCRTWSSLNPYDAWRALRSLRQGPNQH